MWKQVGAGLRAIAEEAASTVAELRDVHDPRSWEDHREAGLAIGTQPGGKQAPLTSTAPSSSDVATRLAALKAKLQSDSVQSASDSVNPSKTQTHQQQQSSSLSTIHRNSLPSRPSASLEGQQHQHTMSVPSADVQVLGARPTEQDQAQQHMEQKPSHAIPAANEMMAGNPHSQELHTVCISQPNTAEESRAEHRNEQVHWQPHEAAEGRHCVHNNPNGNVQPDATEDCRLKKLQTELENAHMRVSTLEALVAKQDQVRIALEGKLEETSARCTAMQSELERQRSVESQTASDSGSTGIENESLTQELGRMRAALAATESDRAALKQQLAKLKAQMLGDQEDEEEKIRWRVDAEVKLAMEKAGAGSHAELAEARAAVAASQERVSRAEEAAAQWERRAAARDAEIANMQRVLGELSYESDAAERLRNELRSMQAQVHGLKQKLESALETCSSAEARAEHARAEAAAARHETAAARDAEAAARREALAAIEGREKALQQLFEQNNATQPFKKESVVAALVHVALHCRGGNKAASVVAEKLGLSREELESAVSEGKNTGKHDSGTPDSEPASLSLAWQDFLRKEIQETVS